MTSLVWCSFKYGRAVESNFFQICPRITKALDLKKVSCVTLWIHFLLLAENLCAANKFQIQIEIWIQAQKS